MLSTSLKRLPVVAAAHANAAHLKRAIANAAATAAAHQRLSAVRAGLHTQAPLRLQQQQSEVQDGTSRHATANVDVEDAEANTGHEGPASESRSGRLNMGSSSGAMDYGGQQGAGEEHEAGRGRRSGGAGRHPRRGGQLARRGGGMSDPFDVEREFNSLQNSVNQLFNDFDRNMGGGLLGGRGGGNGGLLSSFLPRNMGFPPMLGSPMFGFPSLLGGGGQQQQQGLLGDSSAVDDALALQDPETALDLIRPVGAAMKIDVEEEKDKYRVVAEVPGFKQSDLKVRVDGDVLTIEGHHREEHKREDKQKRFLRSERVVRSVRRQLRLPADAEHVPSSVKAQYADGLLKIEVRKLPAEQLKGHVQIAGPSSEQSGAAGKQPEKQSEPKLTDSGQEVKQSTSDANAQEVERRMM